VKRRLGFLLVLVCALGAPMPLAGAAPAPPAAKLKLTRVATRQQPTGLVPRAGDPNLYVMERLGKVRAMRPDGSDAGVYLDLTGQVSTGAEEGLLGMAFSPDGTTSYVHYVDKAKASHIVEHKVKVVGDTVAADPASRREVLTIAGTKRGHHYGGWLDVTPDGMLWIALGDGNGDGDKLGRAQDLSTLMGKILRIDPKPAAGLGYSIPAGNPFVKRPGARPEIWAYGLRNPWRASIDRTTGALWIGDVGEGHYEEVNRSTGGENFGWPLVEANHRLRGAAPTGSTPPVYEFPHAGGKCAVMGGYVYRGAALPALKGIYVFADLCTGHLTGLVQAAGKFTPIEVSAGTPVVTSLGVDSAGELYATSLNGGVFKLVAGS